MARTAISQPRFLARDFGTALSFAAGTNNVDCGTPAAVTALANITIEAWIKPNIIARTDFVGQWLSSAGQRHFIIDTQTNGAVEFYLSTTGSDFPTAGSGGFRLVANNWYHIVGTYDGANINLYINGVLRGGPTVQTGSLNTGSTQKLFIGKTADGNNANAVIDTVRIWSTGFTAQQVSDLYYNGTIPSTPVVEYLMNEGTGTTVANTGSASSANGTITGAIFTSDVPTRSRS